MYYNASQVLRMQDQFVNPRANARERRPRRRSRKHLIAPLLLFFTLLLQLWVRVEIVERGYRLETLRESALKQDTSLRQLRLELAYVSRPKSLTDQAGQKLGLNPLCPQRVRRLE